MIYTFFSLCTLREGFTRSAVKSILKKEVIKGKTNNWEHWAFVGSAEESFMRIPRNGSEVAKSGNKPSFQTSPQAWHIGGRVSSSFAGEIGEVAVFNVPLSEGDINTIMTKGLSRALGWTAVYLKEKLATIWGRVKVQ